MALGLTLQPVQVAADNYKGTITDSYENFLNGLYARLHRIYYRPVLSTAYGTETIDVTLDERRRDPMANYRPQNPGLPAI